MPKLYKEFLIKGQPYWAKGIMWEEVLENGKSIKKSKLIETKKKLEKQDKKHKYKIK